MRRRTLITGAAAGGIGGITLIGTGAFDTARAERTATVNFANDEDTYLGLVSKSAYATTDGDGELALVFGDVSGGGNGIGRNSQFFFDEVFAVVNQGTETVSITATSDTDAFDGEFRLYPTGDRDGGLNDPDNAVTLETGTEQSVGTYIETGDVDVTNELDIDITIEAASEEGDQPDDPEPEPTEFVDELVFDSTASLLAENGRLPEEAIAVAAESTAESTDADGNGDDTSYPDDAPLPLMAVDQDLPVVAFGFPFAQDGLTFDEYGNEEVLLNVFDEYADSDTVLWDEGHGQFYDLDSHSGFADYTGENGYSVKATTDLESDLPGSASVIVITSPSDPFSENEIDALSSFADGGGLIVLMDQSDFNDFDETANLDALANGLDSQIRFNDNQVSDGENNDGAEFAPTTTDLDTESYPELFADREGLGLELDPSEEYDVEITNVTDGDTADVEFPEGQVEAVRILGIDTPETGDTEERLQEYEGIDDGPALKDKGDDATKYAQDKLPEGETVTLSFDENEGLRGNFGRLLGFLELPDGSVYNATVIEDGWARVYDSGLANHDEYWDLERAARDAGDGIWDISDVDATPVVGDDPVKELFVPFASSVATANGDIADDRVPVASEADDPLVGVDEANNVALVGGPLAKESFESGEGGAGTEPYGNYVFLANLIDAISDEGREGSVVIDGGHGQFAADYALSAEDAAYFQRYLEGFAVEFDGKNDFDDDLGRDLAEARAVIVTAPDNALGSDEVAAIEDFRDDGGAVILASAAGSEASGARANLDALADDLGSDLRTGNAVTDEENNLDDDPTVPTTANFNTDFDLFDAYGDGDGGDGGSGGSLAFVEVSEDTSGNDLEDPQENVVFENDGDDALDLTGYTVSDETTKEYSFPDGFTLPSGEQVTLYSGEGTETDAELYWGRTGGAIWNNSGDTVFVEDPDGNVVIDRGY